MWAWQYIFPLHGNTYVVIVHGPLPVKHILYRAMVQHHKPCENITISFIDDKVWDWLKKASLSNILICVRSLVIIILYSECIVILCLDKEVRVCVMSSGQPW